MATPADLVRAELQDNHGRYIFGGTKPVPGLDCSGLNYYYLQQLGVHEITAHRTAEAQYEWCKAAGTLMSVAEGRSTLGAWGFVKHPRTYVHHVVTSLGNGSTIEAANTKDGVGVFRWDGRFDFAGMCPALTTSPPPINWNQVRKLAAATYLPWFGLLATPLSPQNQAGDPIKMLQEVINLIVPTAGLAITSAYDTATSLQVASFQHAMNTLKPGSIDDAFPGVFSAKTKFLMDLALINIAHG